MSVPIVIFAVWGTFMSTVLSAAVVYYGTRWITFCTSIPFIESLAFGALISSIDPIAVLSVLSNMGMSDKDPIYVLIFGESLLNDGVAIVLFQTLVHFMDEKIVIDSEAVSLMLS
jgi:NhaP-type Na+/H+ or K+/H+ antiporter